MGLSPKQIRSIHPEISSALITKARKKYTSIPAIFKGGRHKGITLRVMQNIAQARMMKANGKTYLEIGMELGVSRQRAQQLLRVRPATRDTRCLRCGCHPGTGRIHYHHLDYKHDVVVPLCISCHTRETVKSRWNKYRLTNPSSGEKCAA